MYVYTELVIKILIFSYYAESFIQNESAFKMHKMNGN